VIRTRLQGALASKGARAGMLVLGASLLGHVGNYLFYVIAGHSLGRERFAEVSSMIAFATIIYTPFSGLQASVARDVARLRTAGDQSGVSGYVRLVARRVGPLLAALAVVLVVAAPLISRWLKLESGWLAGLAVIWILLWILLMIGGSIAQGLERFGIVGFTFAGPQGLLRPLFLPLGILVAGTSGSMLAMIAATIVGLIVLVAPVRSAVATPPRPVVSITVAAPILALVSFAIITNADQLMAKSVLTPADASLYSAAALLGKIALFAPAALSVVLLPRASAARARGHDPGGEVLTTIAVTAATGLAITTVLALMPPGFLALTFGPGFVDARPLLGPLALVMTGAAVLNVHITAALASMERWIGPFMAGLAVLCVGLLALLHGAPAQIVLAIGITIAAGLLMIEVVAGSGIVRLSLRLRRRAAARAS